jgi:hypothetical protein
MSSKFQNGLSRIRYFDNSDSKLLPSPGSGEFVAAFTKAQITLLFLIASVPRRTKLVNLPDNC